MVRLRAPGPSANLTAGRGSVPACVHLKTKRTMNRLAGKRVLVTGASSGIGAACARAFGERSANLVLVARRLSRIEALAEEIRGAHGVDALTAPLDVTDREAVVAFVAGLEEDGILPDVLVNNAGKARGLGKLHEGDIDDWEDMIDTNVKGLLYVSRAILPHMVARNSGHVINIGSIAGRWVYPGGNVYNASKFAVYALTEAMNLDLVGTKVRVSSIDPGLVHTEFSEVRFHGDTERAESVYKGYTPLSADDVADAVLYVANTPEHVDVLDLVILPTDQRNAYVLHKEEV